MRLVVPALYEFPPSESAWWRILSWVCGAMVLTLVVVLWISV